jgi:hypothetical protein
MRAEILITTYKRAELLRSGLASIKRHPWLRITVLDEGFDQQTVNVCNGAMVNRIHTALSKPNRESWRVPGFALNIGARLSQADVIIISCAEMWHSVNACEILTQTVEQDPMALAITAGKDQQVDGTFIPLNTKLPFLMALKREHYMEIGGYDEDFVGAAFDDNDIVDRLIEHGCHYTMTPAQCVHLYHARSTKDKRAAGRHARNKQLYLERKGVIHRNVGRPWGVFND